MAIHLYPNKFLYSQAFPPVLATFLANFQLLLPGWLSSWQLKMVYTNFDVFSPKTSLPHRCPLAVVNAIILISWEGFRLPPNCCRLPDLYVPFPILELQALIASYLNSGNRCLSLSIYCLLSSKSNLLPLPNTI